MLLSYKLFESNINIDDLVVCVGNIDGLKTRNHIGVLKENGIEFINRFSEKLHNLGGRIKSKNGWYLTNHNWIEPFEDNIGPKRLPLFYSRGFKEIIEKNQNLNFLLDYQRIFYSEFSYVDFTLKNDSISCLTKSNFDKLENKDEVWTTSLRNNVKIGRFLKTILFNEDDSTISDYVNEYKFSYNLAKDDLGTFKVFKGISMAKWFSYMSYAPGGGSLHSSCMKHIKSQRRLPIYTDNPDKVKMLAILNPDDKLLGRTLIWKLDEPYGHIYMDRIYVAEDYIEKIFKEYARKKGFLTKDVVDKEKIKMIVKLKRDFGPPKNNPFMDTFRYFVKDKNYLTNMIDNKWFKTGEYYEYADHD